MRFVPKPGLINPAQARDRLANEFQRAGWRVKIFGDLGIEISVEGSCPEDSEDRKSQLERKFAGRGYFNEGSLHYLPVPRYEPGEVYFRF